MRYDIEQTKLDCRYVARANLISVNSALIKHITLMYLYGKSLSVLCFWYRKLRSRLKLI